MSIGGGISANGLLSIWVSYCPNYIPRVRLENDLTICRKDLQGPNRTYDLMIWDCSNQIVKLISQFAVYNLTICQNKLHIFDANRQTHFLSINKIWDLTICRTNSQPKNLRLFAAMISKYWVSTNYGSSWSLILLFLRYFLVKQTDNKWQQVTTFQIFYHLTTILRPSNNFYDASWILWMTLTTIVKTCWWLWQQPVKTCWWPMMMTPTNIVTTMSSEQAEMYVVLVWINRLIVWSLLLLQQLILGKCLFEHKRLYGSLWALDEVKGLT